MVVETGATCGGSFTDPFTGLFGTARDDRYIVMAGPSAPCFQEYNCEWVGIGIIRGYMWVPSDNGGQEALWRESTQLRCEIADEVTTYPMTRETLVLATEEDCFGE